MSGIKPITRRTWLAIAAGLVIGVRLRQAAADDNNQRRASIAVPNFSGSLSAGDTTAHDITELVISDLKAVGRLTLIEPDGLVEETINAPPHFDKWRSIHADCLIIGNIARAPDQRVKVEFRLWEMASGHQLLGAQYMLQPDDWRRSAHAIADAVLERLVGGTKGVRG
jgi:TolB protein